jgi:hypothetical protein
MADETLVTEFRLVDHYSAGVQKMSGSTQSFLASAKGIGPALSIIGSVGAIAAAGVATGAAALLSFANSASEAAASFDTMKRTFAGALGGIQQGAQAMAYLENYATKSAFGLEDLARASAQLAASGLDVGRFLPIIERFALVASGVDPQGLIQVAGALARVKGGSFGEAMEVFRKAGVGANDLQAQGIKVSKAGEIQAQAGQVFDAIQKISEGRLKTIADSISGGAENIRANVGDVAGQAFRQIGDEVNKTLLPFLQSFTGELKILVDSGAVSVITREFLGLAPTGVELGSVFEELAVAAAGLPHKLQKLGEGFGAVGDAIGWLISHSPLGLVLDAGFRGATGKSFAENFKSTYDDPNVSEDIRERIRKARKAAEMGMGGGPDFPKLPPDSNPPPTVDSVARNTAKLVDLAQKSFDIQRQILGGGARAEEAASAVRIGNALGLNNSMGGKPERLLLQFAAELRAEILGNQIGMSRNSGMPNRVARR